MVAATARVRTGGGLTRLRRIDTRPTAPSAEPPRARRSPLRRLIRWSLGCAVVLAVGAVVWLPSLQVVAVGVVDGNVVTLTAPAAVRVREMSLEAGQRCEPGQTLAQLVGNDVAARRGVFESQLEAARLRLKLVKAGGVLGDWQLGQRLDERDRLAAEVESGRAAVTDAQARLEHAEWELKVFSELDDQSLASRRELDTLQTQVITAGAELERARAGLEGSRSRLARHKELAPDGSNGVELRQTELALLESAVREAEQRLREFDWQSGTRTLVAPFAGRVDRVHADAGSCCQEGDPLLTIYDPSSLRVIAYVKPCDGEKWSAGMKVRMYAEGSSRRISGVIREVHVAWARVPTFLQKALPESSAVTAVIEVEPADRERLAPNMTLKIVAARG